VRSTCAPTLVCFVGARVLRLTPLVRPSTCAPTLLCSPLVSSSETEAEHSMYSCTRVITRFRGAMGWLRLVGSLKLQVSFAEHRLFYRALLQKRPIILRSLLLEATPYCLLAPTVAPFEFLRGGPPNGDPLCSQGHLSPRISLAAGVWIDRVCRR